MTSRYRVAQAAQDDLNEIWLYIAKDNITAADAVVEACFKEFLDLMKLPQLGHHRPDIPERCLAKTLRRYPNYVIVYRINKKVLEVARILHGSRNFETQFKEQK